METELTTAPADVETIVRIAQQAARPHELASADDFNGVLPFAVADGVRIETVDLEQYESNPRRKRGTYTFGTVDALADYVARHESDATTIWVHPTKNRIEAVLDDHESFEVVNDDEDAVVTKWRGAAGHGDHRAILELITTPEWDHWIKRDGQLVSQIDFATHIEDGLREIRTPEPTVMLELAESFHAKSDIVFRSANRIQDGQVQVKYDENVEATAGREANMKIPQTFDLAIAPFIGEPAYAITARLRYRVGNGKLTIGYKLDRPHMIVDDALGKIRERLDARFEGIVFNGAPR